MMMLCLAGTAPAVPAAQKALPGDGKLKVALHFFPRRNHKL
jgi:hypothetical protein